MSDRPIVTVLIPARNEEADIAGCIDGIGTQDYGADRMQLIVVDAASDDGTAAEVRRAAARYPFVEVLIEQNPQVRTSIGLNVGLDRAKGDYVARIDARSRVPSNYVSTCVRTLEADAGVGVAGGAQIAVARRESDSPTGDAIARALRNRWATGLSRYRLAKASGPSDTVWMGFFRTAELRALGGWSAEVALNEDFDLNRRYRERGLIVWFDHTLQSGYLPRRSYRLLASQYFYFGRVKGTWWARGDRPVPRQLALLAAPVVAGAAVATGWRTVGPVVALAVPAGLLALEAAGSDGPATPAMHARSAAAVAVLSGSWWIGTVAGFAGELVGVRHQHG